MIPPHDADLHCMDIRDMNIRYLIMMTPHCDDIHYMDIHYSKMFTPHDDYIHYTLY